MSVYYNDPDPAETNDWLQSLEGVIAAEGEEKADYLLGALTAGIVLTLNYLENRRAAESPTEIDSDAAIAEKWKGG